MEANQSSEFTNKIDYSKFIKGRVVQGATQLTISEADILNLNEIKEKDAFLSDFLKDFNFNKNTSIVERNMSYTCYMFEFNQTIYEIKVGNKDDALFLSKENKLLKRVAKKNFTFEPIGYSEGDFYCYLLTLHQHGIPISNIGIDKITDQLDVFAKYLSNFHNSFEYKQNQRKQFEEDFFAYGNFEYIMGKDLYYKCLRDKKIQTLISALKNIKENYIMHSDFPENETTLCHLNLNLKNILYRSGNYRFINFTNSYNLNPMWDLAFFCINYNFHEFPILQEQFFNKYQEYSKFNKKVPYDLFLNYKSLAFKLQFYKLICDYIYKAFLVQDQDNLLDLFIKYQQLRPYIESEMPGYLMFSDDVFYQFG